MGTSTSGLGSPSKQPITSSGGSDSTSPKIAPPARFKEARTSIGKFAGTGSLDHLKRGLKHYFSKGLGGGGTAVRRFSGTVHTAGALFDTLSESGIEQLSVSEDELNASVLTEDSVDKIIDSIIEAVQPIDGTQDGEASRISIRNALSKLLNDFPDADLRNLSEEQKIFVANNFIAQDVFRRFELDLGKKIQEKAPSPTDALSILEEAEDYITEIVAAKFREQALDVKNLSGNKIMKIAQKSLELAFKLFQRGV